MRELRELLAATGLSTFVCFDLETTGLDDDCEIIEIGAVRYRNGEEEARFNQLVHPQTAIPPRITKLTGIKPGMVRDARRIEEVLPDFLDFLGEAPVVAHNIAFDLGMLTRWCKRLGLAYEAPLLAVDTVPLAQTLLPTVSNHRLSELAGWFDINLDKAHRAGDDAAATAELLLHLLRVLRGLPLVQLRELVILTRATGDVLETLCAGAYEVYRQHGGPEDFARFLPETTGNVYHKADLEGEDSASMDDWFGDTGLLQEALPGFTLRPAQVELAREAARTLGWQATPGFLAAEAATGTGKSFAYLVPAILRGRELVSQGERGVVISTHTRNLQDQLFREDIPRLGRLLRGPLKAVLLKGRGNYICGQRWQRLLEEAQDRLSVKDRLKLLPLVVWLAQTRTGDVEECVGFHYRNAPALWAQLRSESQHCANPRCRASERCFVNRARRQAADAHLLVVNHSLVLSDLEVEGRVLGEYSCLVLDEAHNLQACAERHLRKGFSFGMLQNRTRALYSPGDGRGLLRQLRSRLLTGLPEGATRDTVIHSLEECAEALAAYDEPLSSLREQLIEGQRERWAEQIARTRFTQKQRYTPEENPLRMYYALQQELDQYLPRLKRAIEQTTRLLEELPADFRDAHPEVEGEFHSLGGQVLEACTLENELAAYEGADEVCWYEVHPVSYETTFFRCPLDLGRQLAAKLYSRLSSLLLVSATLAVDGSFDYFLGSTGLNQQERPVECRVYGSPFDLERQLRFFIPNWLPEPSGKNAWAYAAQLAELLGELATSFQKGTLVLFTSYGLLNRTYEELLARLDYRQTPLLAQGMDGPRHEILRRFREAGNAILLGTDSFWEGVDVPGDALQLLVMTKLPFAVPSEPMVAARMEALDRSGRNSFMEYSVPEAVIRFRQGSGRLIRHEQDRGIFLLLDKRVIQKRYGEQFTGSIGAPSKVFYQERELLRACDNFWRK